MGSLHQQKSFLSMSKSAVRQFCDQSLQLRIRGDLYLESSGSPPVDLRLPTFETRSIRTHSVASRRSPDRRLRSVRRQQRCRE